MSDVCDFKGRLTCNRYGVNVHVVYVSYTASDDRVAARLLQHACCWCRPCFFCDNEYCPTFLVVTVQGLLVVTEETGSTPFTTGNIDSGQLQLLFSGNRRAATLSSDAVYDIFWRPIRDNYQRSIRGISTICAKQLSTNPTRANPSQYGGEQRDVERRL